MKILLTCHYSFDANAGAAGVTWRLGQEYEKLGHQVFYYSLNNLPNRLHPLGKFITFPEFVASKISQLCHQESIDMVDASTGDGWVWGILQKQKKNCPLLVARCHGLEHIEHLEYLEEAQRGNLQLSWKYGLYRGGFRLWESATSMRHSDLVLLLNNCDAKYVIENLGVKSERVRIVPNAIADEFLNLPFEPLPEVENGVIRIAQIGTYIGRKGIHYSVPALNKILARYPQVEVTFLGTQCFECQDPLKVYEDFDRAVRDRVKVVPYYTNEKLPNLLKGHQIKLFPTISEGFGIALIEAMACGLAPVTTATPGPLEIVEDGRDAIVIPSRNSHAIEQALEKLICDRRYLEKLRRNAYATAQRYSWERIARQNLAFYEQAFQQRKCAS